jgi:hypothetical protein
LNVLETEALRNIFGAKREEVWNILSYNEELCHLYRIVKSRRLWWVQHVTQIGIQELYTEF